MARGTASGCDAAEPGWPAQEAHSGAATWQGGHAARWAPVWGATCKVGKRGDSDDS